MSSSATPKPGPPMLANAFKHLAAAILTANDLSPVADLIMRRNASEYAVEAALPPEPSKAFRSIYNASCRTNSYVWNIANSLKGSTANYNRLGAFVKWELTYDAEIKALCQFIDPPRKKKWNIELPYFLFF